MVNSPVLYEAYPHAGEFVVNVLHIGENTGRLHVSVFRTGQEILNRLVPVSYDAIFGPDINDLSEWQELSEEAIQAYLVGSIEKEGESK